MRAIEELGRDQDQDQEDERPSPPMGAEGHVGMGLDADKPWPTSSDHHPHVIDDIESNRVDENDANDEIAKVRGNKNNESNR